MYFPRPNNGKISFQALENGRNISSLILIIDVQAYNQVVDFDQLMLWTEHRSIIEEYPSPNPAEGKTIRNMCDNIHYKCLFNLNVYLLQYV